MALSKVELASHHSHDLGGALRIGIGCWGCFSIHELGFSALGLQGFGSTVGARVCEASQHLGYRLASDVQVDDGCPRQMGPWQRRPERERERERERETDRERGSEGLGCRVEPLHPESTTREFGGHNFGNQRHRNASNPQNPKIGVNPNSRNSKPEPQSLNTLNPEKF